MNDLKNDILYEVKVIMGWNDKACEAWWTTPNMNFGDMSPKQMVDEGSGKHLLEYIKRLRN